MKRTGLISLCTLASFGAIALWTSDARADCDWTVRGRLQVDHVIPDLPVSPAISGLGGVEVKVSAKEKVAGIWGSWNAWPTVRTDGDGDFEVRKSKNCDGRRFKIEVKFSDSQLEVRHGTATSSLEKVEWYTIVEDLSGEHAAGTTDFGNKIFAASGSLDLDNVEARAHADIWYVYKQAIAKAASFGADHAFTTQVKVKFPHDGVAPDDVESSYANPTTKVIYIFKADNGSESHLDVDTLLHELGHVWAYNHSSGEFCLTETLVTTQNTHGLVADSCVAFHEGFAETFGDEMQRALFGRAADLPFHRPKLNAGIGGTALTNKTLMQRHDSGWLSVFRTLLTPSLHKYDFGTPGGSMSGSTIAVKSPLPIGCTSPALSFADLLSVFNAGGSFNAKLSRDETTITRFLERAAGRLGNLTAADADTIEALVDPASSVQPSDELCSIVIGPAGPIGPIVPH